MGKTSKRRQEDFKRVQENWENIAGMEKSKRKAKKGVDKLDERD